MDNLEKNFKKYIILVFLIFIVLISIVFFSSELTFHHHIHSKIFNHISKIYEENMKGQLKYNLNIIFNEIEEQKSELERKTKKMVKADVLKAHNIAMKLYNQFKGRIDDKKLQTLILNTLSALKKDDKYIFGADFNGINQLNPVIPRGVNTYNFKDIKGKYIVRKMINIAKEKNEGFIEYYWYKPSNPKKYIKKVSFIKKFAPYNWYIGEGYYYVDMEQKIKENIIEFINRLNSSKHHIFSYFLLEKAPVIKILAGKIDNSKMLNLKKLDNQPFYIKKANKIFAISLYKEWDWIIGVKANLEYFNSNINKEQKFIKKTFINYSILLLIAFVIIFTIAIFISIYLANKISYRLSKYRKEIEAKELFEKKLIDSIPTPLFLKSTDGTFLDCNIEFENFFGIKEEELLKLKKEDIPFELEILDKMLIADALLDKIHKVSEVQLKNRHGEFRDLQVYKSIFRDFNNEIVGIIVVLFDVTERKKLEYKLKEFSFKDELTGLYNRRYFNDAINKQMQMFKRHKIPFSLLMFDIDHFKRVNDKYGHPVGDLVLKELAYIVQKNIRISDILCRVGGEEFVIIATNASLEHAKKLAEKLRRKVEEKSFDEVGTITISIGVTEVQPSDNVESLLNRVDNALYSAKENGRNRVEFV